jgi:hypothetical protein
VRVRAVPLGPSSGSFKDRSRFEKRLDPEGAELTADARVLKSTEWGLLIVKHAVDRYAPGEELRRHAPGALYVSAAYVGMKPELCVIGDSDSVFLVFIGDDRQDGAKYLLSGDGHVVLHIDEYCRFHEITRLKTLWLALTADQHVRAFLNTFADV